MTEDRGQSAGIGHSSSWIYRLASLCFLFYHILSSQVPQLTEVEVREPDYILSGLSNYITDILGWTP